MPISGMKSDSWSGASPVDGATAAAASDDSSRSVMRFLPDPGYPMSSDSTPRARLRPIPTRRPSNARAVDRARDSVDELVPEPSDGHQVLGVMRVVLDLLAEPLDVD